MRLQAQDGLIAGCTVMSGHGAGGAQRLTKLRLWYERVIEYEILSDIVEPPSVPQRAIPLTKDGRSRSRSPQRSFLAPEPSPFSQAAMVARHHAWIKKCCLDVYYHSSWVNLIAFRGDNDCDSDSVP